MPKFIKKYFYFVVAGGFFLLLEILLIKPALVWLILAVSVAWLILYYLLLLSRELFLRFYLFIFSPILFYLSSFLFLIFLIPQIDFIFKHIFVVFVSLMLGLSYFIFYGYLTKSERYQLSAVQNIFDYLNLLTIFFFSAVLFNTGFFIDIPFWFNQFLVAVLVVVLFYQNLWSHKLLNQNNFIFLPLLGLVFTELFWAVGLLPINFYASGLLMALFYYLFSGLINDYLLGILNKKLTKKYIIIFLIIMSIVLLTADWL